MTSNDPRFLVFRATASAYFVLGGIFGFMTLLSAILVSADRSMIPALVACVVAWLFVYLWLSLFRIVVAHDFLSYRGLFRGTCEFRFADIRRIAVESGVKNYSDRFKPFVRLAIEPQQELNSRPVYVNLKVLSIADIRHLRGILKEIYQAMGKADVVRNL